MTELEEYIERKKKFFEGKPELKDEYEAFMKKIEVEIETEPSNHPKDERAVVTLYQSPRCGFCKKIAPEMDLVKSKLEDVIFKEVNCLEDPEACKEKRVSGYPTLIFEDSKGKTFVTKGYKTSDKIVGFIDQSLKGTFKEEIQEPQKLSTFVLRVPLEEWPEVHSKLYANAKTIPVIINTNLENKGKKKYMIASLVTKSKRIEVDINKYRF
jgi:thiol-disulfide isomerase/thioredoxin